MRRFVVLTALLGLTACGGEMLPEESQAPESSQEAVPAQVAAPAAGEVSAEAVCTGTSWECYCGQFKTQATCNEATRCWWNFKCVPTYGN